MKGRVAVEAGPRLRADWTWAPSVLGEAQISRLSRLWFEALAGICAHVRDGGGGLTPSDVASARLNQRQIDELARQYQIADVLPLTALQQGLLFHANTARGDDDLYAVQLEIGVTGPLDADRLRDAVQTVIARHPNLVARFCQHAKARSRERASARPRLTLSPAGQRRCRHVVRARPARRSVRRTAERQAKLVPETGRHPQGHRVGRPDHRG